jgi:hypothetical protein
MSTCVSTVCQSMSGWVCRMNQGDLEGTVTSVGVLMPVRPKVGDKWAPASLSGISFHPAALGSGAQMAWSWVSSLGNSTILPSELLLI